MSTQMPAAADLRGEEVLELAEEALTNRKLAEALAYFDEAERLHADRSRCCAGRWMASMLAGDFAAAWAENDKIRRLGFADPDRFWNGEEIDGKHLMIRCLHGLGDAVQMLRYAGRLAASARSVVYEMPPRLLPLAGCFTGVTEAITWGEAAPRLQPEWEVQIEVMELPYLFRTGVQDLPVTTRYLNTSAVVPRGLCAGRFQKRRAGVVWSSGEWDPERSLPVEALRMLLAESSVEWWSLQGGTAAKLADGLGLRTPPGEGLVSMAAAMAEMDLVITVDTLAAHMAGAMGMPVWVMLQWAADWRWMTGREDSPWYPTMRLFRQPSPGDWAGVVDAVQRSLVSWS